VDRMKFFKYKDLKFIRYWMLTSVLILAGSIFSSIGYGVYQSVIAVKDMSLTQQNELTRGIPSFILTDVIASFLIAVAIVLAVNMVKGTKISRFFIRRVVICTILISIALPLAILGNFVLMTSLTWSYFTNISLISVIVSSAIYGIVKNVMPNWQEIRSSFVNLNFND
jgi:hypothetical protein